jgi:aspartyl-tRNA synthetase
MTIKEHYFEVLDVLGDMFYYIFSNLEKWFMKELDIIKQQYHILIYYLLNNLRS